MIESYRVNCVFALSHSPASVLICRLKVAVFDIDVPLLPGTKLVCHHLQESFGAHIVKLINTLDRTSGVVVRAHPRCIPKHSSATIDISVDTPLCVEAYGTCRELGRVLLRSSGKVVAAGIIMEVL